MVHCRRLRTLAMAVVAGLLLSGGLTACGSLDLFQQEDEQPDVQVLTIKQVKRALLTAKDVGPGMKKARLTGGDSDMGCLDTAMDIYIPVLAERSVRYQTAPAAEMALVEHTVSSFPDSPSKVSGHIDELRRALRGCRKIRTTDGAGFTLQLRVTENAKKPTSAVDEQLNVNITGTMSKAGVSIPFAMWVRMSRIDNHASSLAVGHVGKLRPALVDAYAKKAAKRLDRVVRRASRQPAVG